MKHRVLDDVVLVHSHFSANLAQIAFESVVSIVNSLHNSQELIRDQQGRNSLLATYLYWVFRLPDPPRDMQNLGSDVMVVLPFNAVICVFSLYLMMNVLCECFQARGA